MARVVSPRFFRILLAVLCPVFVLSPPRLSAIQEVPVQAPKAAPEPSWRMQQMATTPGPLQPPDGKWLVDENGIEYFPFDVERREGQYKWLGEDHKRVRLPYGLIFDVVSYDDAKFVVKIYRQPEAVAPPVKPKEVVEPYPGSSPTENRLDFLPFGEGLPAQGQWRQGFDLADLDGDGHLDIVHGPARKTGTRPAVYLGDGRGTWRLWRTARFPAVAFDYGDAAVGDLNGDGRPDLVLASHLRGISALVQKTPGVFELWSEGIEFAARPDPTTGAVAFSSREVEIFDWNRDGRPDIVALGEGPHLAIARGAGDAKASAGSRGVVVYLNDGDGTWTKTGGTSSQEGVFGDDLVIADLDGDGREEVFTGTAVQGLKSVLFRNAPDGLPEARLVEGLRNRAIVRGVAVGDFDRDGKADVAVGFLSFEGTTWRTGVDVLLSRPEGKLERRGLWSEEGRAAITGLAAGDLDGNGALDLVALTGEGESWVFLGDGRGGFVREESPEVGEPGCGGYHVELADLDGDGAAEVVAGFAGEGSSLFGAQGRGFAQESCRSGGSLRAWRPVPRREVQVQEKP